MRFITDFSLSFDMRPQAACSINHLNIIYFKIGDGSRFNNHCLLHGIFANVAYVRLKFSLRQEYLDVIATGNLNNIEVHIVCWTVSLL